MDESACDIRLHSGTKRDVGKTFQGTNAKAQSASNNWQRDMLLTGDSNLGEVTQRWSSNLNAPAHLQQHVLSRALLRETAGT
jgi:hypothetical protein